MDIESLVADGTVSWAEINWKYSADDMQQERYEIRSSSFPRRWKGIQEAGIRHLYRYTHIHVHIITTTFILPNQYKLRSRIHMTLPIWRKCMENGLPSSNCQCGATFLSRTRWGDCRCKLRLINSLFIRVIPSSNCLIWSVVYGSPRRLGLLRNYDNADERLFWKVLCAVGTMYLVNSCHGILTRNTTSGNDAMIQLCVRKRTSVW